MGTVARASAFEERIAGRYVVERILGRGGAGVVYAAVDTADGSRVALKRLLGKSASDTQLFKLEYRTLASIKHPNIVEVFEYGTDAQGSYYTMELLAGGDLSSSAPMPWRAVCSCLREAASILGVLHARRMLHRDLSARNLWKLPDGRFKLIDFGALAPFGVASDIVGTPPFIPPEALQGQPLDQRADLYALGALGYWLLTSVHAYPATAIGQLARYWQQAPAIPSSLTSLFDSPGDDRIPAAVDELILALLHPNPHARPLNTAEVIDRLNTIAGSIPTEHELPAHAFLHSKVFVGRTPERECVSQLLTKAESGEGQTVLIRAQSGMGRTRLLEEIAVMARLAGAHVLAAERAFVPGPYATANALALRLLRTLPEEARRAALPHSHLVAQLSPELRAALQMGSIQLPISQPAAERMRLQVALKDWLLEISRQRLLAITIDDIETIDEESQALFAALAMSARSSRLLLAVTSLHENGIALSAAVERLKASASGLRLVPLDAAETRELFGSMFGEVPYLDRLSERLRKVAQGSPARCLGLAEHLVRSGTIKYVDRMWTLPTDLPPHAVPTVVRAANLKALDGLSSEQRSFAELLSIDAGQLSFDACLELSERGVTECELLLDSCVQAGVLSMNGARFRVANEEMRQELLSTMAIERRRAAHLRLGHYQAQSLAHLPLEGCLNVGLHLLRGDSLREGLNVVNQAAIIYARGQFNRLATGAPLLEQAVGILSQRGIAAREYPHALCALAIAGYFVDRRYAVAFGDPAVTVMQQMLRLDRARRFSFLGQRVALAATLLVAGALLWIRGSAGMRLAEAIRLFLTVCSSLAGAASVSLHHKDVARYAQCIKPLAALGRDHIAHFIYAFSDALALLPQDKPGEAVARWEGLISRLEGPRQIHGMYEELRAEYLAGAYFSLGIAVSWRDTSRTLAIADRLEGFSPMQAMSADHLRACYYAHRGDLAYSAVCRRRFEMLAVQLGTAWQIETWSPADSSALALRLNDAVLMKRATQDVQRLAAALPWLKFEELHAQGTYLVLRGRYAEALPFLDRDEVPQAEAGWSRTRGTLARALNGLGQYRRALEVCEDVLARLDERDLTFCTMNMNVQIEAALARANLGRNAEAAEDLDRLIAQHGVEAGPVTLGALHEARAKVSLLGRDFEGCDQHLRKMRGWLVPTGIPTLIELCDNVERALERTLNDEQGTSSLSSFIEGDAHLLTRVKLALTQSNDGALQRAEKSLRIARELTGAQGGVMIVSEEQRDLVAHDGIGTVKPSLVAWARDRMHRTSAEDETASVESSEYLLDENTMQLGGLTWCVTPLWKREAQQDVVVGAIALGFADGTQRLPSAAVLRVFADCFRPLVGDSSPPRRSRPHRSSLPSDSDIADLDARSDVGDLTRASARPAPKQG